MKHTRRGFIESNAAAGALLGVGRVPQLNAAQSQPPTAMPTPRAKALLSLFGLKYPIFQATHGRATSPELAVAVSNTGAMGALASLEDPEDARKAIFRMRAATRGPFVVNYPLWRGTASLRAALDAGALIVQFSWGMPAKDVPAGE